MKKKCFLLSVIILLFLISGCYVPMLLTDTSPSSEVKLMLADLREFFDDYNNYGRVELNDDEKAFVLYPNSGYLTEVIDNMSIGNPVAMEEWSLFLYKVKFYSAYVSEKLPGYCIIVADPADLDNKIILAKDGEIVVNLVD